MNFSNSILQMMKEMMFLIDEMMKIAKHTLQIKTDKPFAKISSFAIQRYQNFIILQAIFVLQCMHVN